MGWQGHDGRGDTDPPMDENVEETYPPAADSCRHIWDADETGVVCCALCGVCQRYYWPSEFFWIADHYRRDHVMKQTITAHHTLDDDGNPAGGTTVGVGIRIDWQDGPLGRGTERVPPNGAFVEDVIRAAIDRLQFYQTAGKGPLDKVGGRFACRENAIALTHLETALLWLEKRTADRETRKVEGTHTP